MKVKIFSFFLDNQNSKKKMVMQEHDMLAYSLLIPFDVASYIVS